MNDAFIASFFFKGGTMEYIGAVYRPPSEARSLIVQVTLGCSHNQCTFCTMYKDKQFKIRTLEDIFSDLESVSYLKNSVRKIFLADGNALVLKNEILIAIMRKAKEVFPLCEKISVYSAPKDILRKTDEELLELKKEGLSMMYLGIESGSDTVLKNIKKGVTSKEMIEAGQKVKKSGITLSCMLISGIGGKKYSKEHALMSAQVASAINPDYLALLTLLVYENTPLYKEIESGEFQLLNAKEVLLENKLLIENLELEHCIFRSNHASNYVSLDGIFPYDKEKILEEIEDALMDSYEKSEYYRRL